MSSNQDLPDREQLLKAVESAQAAQKAQSTANDLMSKAKQMTDSTQREKILREAYDKEIEANGHSKMAQRLQSGTWQGLGFGGGIGAATGLGIGAGLGTLLGAITAVPATGIGMLVGSATGAIHGPWIKLGGKEQKFEDADPKEVVDALEQGNNLQSKADSEGKNTTATQQNDSKPNNSEGQQPKRKPKKLEVRSQPKPVTEEQLERGHTDATPKLTNNESQKQRKKPKKLEIRSKKTEDSGASQLKN